MKIQLQIIVIFSFLLFAKLQVCAQDNLETNDTTEFFAAEELPKLIIDEKEYNIDEIMAFIKQNLKYPDNGLDCVGKVYISFYVEKDGTVSNKKYERRLCTGFDENAMDVIDLMIKWKPATIRNKPVRFKLLFPIIFNLE